MDEPLNRSLRSLLAICINDLGIHYKSNREFEQARVLCEESAAIRNQLRHQFPNSPDIAVSLAGSYVNLGNINRIQGHFDEANRYYELATELCHWVDSRSPDDVRARRYLRNVSEGRGEYYLVTNQHALALTAFEDAIIRHDAVLAASSSDSGPRLALRRAKTLAHLGQIQECLRVIEQALATTEEDINADGAEKYHAALAYAALIESTVDNIEVDDAERESWATKAIEVLKVAIQYHRADSPARATEWRTDPELDCLRAHPDFLLLQDSFDNESGDGGLPSDQ